MLGLIKVPTYLEEFQFYIVFVKSSVQYNSPLYFGIVVNNVLEVLARKNNIPMFHLIVAKKKEKH